ncbi:MAG: DUF87 domain-containing protein [Vicinamibacterales bacterium]
MQDFEKLGVFYLGKHFDPTTKKVTDDLVLYDSKDLVTHALCVGMTGSGKTGLGIAVIEEAAIDGVPVIVIDPKGDLTNLLLTFPALRPDDFLPWVNEDDARRAGRSTAEFAAEQAERWKKGLSDWGEDGARIQRLRDAADFAIYTPGSTAGLQVSVLTSFTRPTIDEPELLRERVNTAVSSLLALAGVEGEPLKSPEHILLSTILLNAWQAGESPDLPALIQRVQQPPFTRVGVMDVDTFFPQKDRLTFAMALNALIASPGFEVWSQGEPLDVAAFLRSASGKPRVSVFSIAHLDDSQRMFFVSLLLNAVAGWMRSQSGTSSLRAMVYMDEIFGFFPPVANPPSKAPLLTLLKQGRAAGVGVVLATQNPVDLDYKGLSNIGTWWLGRLQTDRDKARVLDGLEGASDSAGFDRAEVDRLLSSLTSRVFLMRNVHEDALTLFQSRWALSYLRGPLGRDDVKKLSAGLKAAAPQASSARVVAPSIAASVAASRPTVPADVAQFFSPEAAAAVSTPLRGMVYAAVSARFLEPKLGLDTTKLLTLAAPITDGAVAVDWEQAERVEWTPDTLEKDAPDGATFGAIPSVALKAKSYDGWTKQLLALLVSTEALALFRSPSTNLVSSADETERDFRARIAHSSRESRDGDLDAIRRKYAAKQAALEERLRKAQQAVQRESEQSTGQKLQAAISVGATLLSMFGSRKAISATNLGRATTAARGIGRTMKESQDVARAGETVEALQKMKEELEVQIQVELDAITASSDAATEKLESVTVKPKKTNLTPKLVALVWTK